MLETAQEVHTPEGVALRLPAAGPVPRALAWAIDLGIRFGILSACSVLLGLLGSAGLGVYLVVLFLVMWGYPILCEGLFNGQTPGKRALELRVVSTDGAPVGWLAAVVRNLLRTVDMLPFGYGCGLVCGLLDARGRRLGDLVAGTLVVHVQAQPPLPAAEAGEAVVPALPLRPQEQWAVVAFAERAPRLTPARQQELANIVAPITGASGAVGVQRLFGLARWLLGGR
jgi:uncharacterized RDD family membrane protein YckC